MERIFRLIEMQSSEIKCSGGKLYRIYRWGNNYLGEKGGYDPDDESEMHCNLNAPNIQ